MSLLLSFKTGASRCFLNMCSVSAYYVTVADLNGDRRLDLVIVSGGQLRVLLGNGDGTFAAPASYSLPTSVGQLVAGDFNGAGLVDVVVSRAGALVSSPTTEAETWVREWTVAPCASKPRRKSRREISTARTSSA
jgi:hypothetical protein